MSAASRLLYLDFEAGLVGDADGAGFETFSERHYADLQVAAREQGATPYTAYPEIDRPVVIALRNGLPTREELSFSAKVLSDRRKLYYHWPAEGVVEVVTPERLRSFRRHVRFVGAYWTWRSLRRGIAVSSADLTFRARSNARRLKRKARELLSRPPQRAALRSGVAKFSFLNEESGRLIARGRGLYVRLDYWAKLSGGGSYGHTVYQAKALNKASSEPIRCLLSSNYQMLADLGIHQTIVPSNSPLADEFALVSTGEAYAKVVEAMIRFYQPAFVFERLVLGNAATARACKEVGVPYIAEFNGSELTMSKVFGGREMANAEKLLALETECFDLADVVSVVSEPVKQAVMEHGVPAGKIFVNPNCVDLEAYHPLPDKERAELRALLGFGPDDVVLGFCGTFGGWHGVEVLAEALPAIAAARASAKFLLIGDGSFKHLVREAVTRAGIGGRVKDVGMVPQQDAARLLGACDIFLSPHSRSMGDKPFFGSPTKLFEYMAYGAGIVCSDLVQLGEVMRPAVMIDDPSRVPAGARSVLTAPGSAADVVKASLLLIDDNALRDLLGGNARAAAEKYYTWDEHVQSLWRFALGQVPRGYHADKLSS